MILSEKQKANIYQPLKGIELELNEGTIRSGKTMSDAQKMAIIYLASPDPNHLVAAYNQEQAYRMFFDCEGFGLAHLFREIGEMRSDRHGDHLWLNVNGVEKKIYYKGGGKANSVGSITGMSFGTVTFLEFNLLHKSFIEEAFRRTLAAKFRYHLAEQNPPAPNHPNLETLKAFQQTGKYLFRHWRPQDNPILTEDRLRDWEEQCRISEYLYQRDWEGQRVMPEGVIYSMFDRERNVTKQIKGNVIETFFTTDGGQGDATTCAFWLVTFHRGKYHLYRIANYYHSGNDSGVVKAMSIYAKEIKQFVGWCYDDLSESLGVELPYWNYFFVDPACKSLREELTLVGIDTDKADNNSRDKVGKNGLKIEVGIERTQSAISNGTLQLYDIEGKYDHYNLIKELGMYVRNDGGVPVDKNNHACDEMRYGVNYFTKTYLT